jgi:hypothetical protein
MRSGAEVRLLVGLPDGVRASKITLRYCLSISETRSFLSSCLDMTPDDEYT